MKFKYKTKWKERHLLKINTVKDVIQFNILRALDNIDKTLDERVEIARHLIHKAFTPITNTNKLANGRKPFDIIKNTRGVRLNKRSDGLTSFIFDTFADAVMSEEEIKDFNYIYDALIKTDLVRHYSYFFTRQDIFDEYQLVQTAHVALELGSKLTEHQTKNLYFTCCGVKDIEELENVEKILESMNVPYVTFREPDIGNQKTSIGVYPIPEHKKGLLRNFPLLTFDRQRG